MTKGHFQVAVLGSGFAGSLMAMVAQRLGFSTILIERGRHPRFAIGESSTPLANLLLEEIAIDYDLPFIRPLCRWGTWQANLPQLGCGLKRGFSFYHHQLDSRFDPDPDRERQLLVGASPNGLALPVKFTEVPVIGRKTVSWKFWAARNRLQKSGSAGLAERLPRQRFPAARHRSP